LHKIIPAASLRPYLIDAIERGIERDEKIANVNARNDTDNVFEISEVPDTAKAS
jgi:hypothetical protein